MPRVFAILLLSASLSYAAPVATLQPDVSRFAIHTPQPEYPAAALQRHLAGSGYFVVQVDRATGHVMSVEVRRSTGQRLLDDAAVRALRQWQFRSGGVLPTHHDPKFSKILVPVTFTP